MAWELEEAVEHYRKQGAPGDQSAVLALLREVQREQGGGIPRSILTAIGEAYGVKDGYFLALIRRIPSLRQGKGPGILRGENLGTKSRRVHGEAGALYAPVRQGTKSSLGRKALASGGRSSGAAAGERSGGRIKRREAYVQRCILQGV